MRAWCSCCGLLLAVLVGACGRFGVEVLSDNFPLPPPDSSDKEVDAPLEPGTDAASVDVASSADSAVDAGLPVAADAGADAWLDTDAALAPNLPVDAAMIVDARVGEAGAGAGVQDAALVDAAAGAPRDAGRDAAASPCAGESVFGLCWYLATENAGCDAECSLHGGYDGRGVAYVGTENQGGTLDACTQILTALVGPGSASAGMRADKLAYGCHVWSADGARWWLQTGPAFDPTAAHREIRVACSCLR